MKGLLKSAENSKIKIDKAQAEFETLKLKEELYNLQHVLYADGKHSVLIILQGLDAAGKDGTIRHVFSSINPMGITVKSFKAPSAEELAHNFMWRIHPHIPSKGMIQIFNRSHYEDILVPFVHKTIDAKIVERRFDIINGFEQNLSDSGTVILKFFLHVSEKEQQKRIKERLTEPHKRWKYDPADTKESPNREKYLAVYEQLFERCSPKFPWHIVPSDHKWYRNHYIASELVKTLKGLKLKYPIK